MKNLKHDVKLWPTETCCNCDVFCLAEKLSFTQECSIYTKIMKRRRLFLDENIENEVCRVDWT